MLKAFREPDVGKPSTLTGVSLDEAIVRRNVSSSHDASKQPKPLNASSGKSVIAKADIPLTKSLAKSLSSCEVRSPIH